MSLRKAVKDVLDAYDKALEQDAHGDLASPMEALRKALAESEGYILVPSCAVRKKPYVPMKDCEIDEVTMAQWGIKQGDIMLVAHRAYARAVLARLGIEVGR